VIDSHSRESATIQAPGLLKISVFYKKQHCLLLEEKQEAIECHVFRQKMSLKIVFY